MTADTVETRLRLPLSWNFIEGVRATVNERLAHAPAELRESAVMVASELAENMVKYGEPLAQDDCGYVTLSIGPGLVEVKTMNGVTSARRAEEVIDRIQAIAASDDVEALFRQRMKEMLESPGDPHSYLGLLRIAYEGNFRLSCDYTAPVLTIIAHREWV
jgi:hypothetical protein